MRAIQTRHSAVIVAAALAATGLVASVMGVARFGPSAIPGGFVVFVALFALGEALEVAFEFRGEHFSFSLIDIPVIVALTSLSGREFVAAAVGASAIRIVRRRTKDPFKVAFGIVNAALESGISFAVFHLAVTGRGPDSPLVLVGLLAGVYAGTTTSTALSTVMIAIANGRWPGFRTPFAIACVGTLVSSLIGLLALQALEADWRTAWVVVGVAVIFWLTYRAYVKLRQRYGSLDLLHTFSHGVAGVTETDDVTLTSLTMAKELLRGEHAQLVFRFPDGIVIKRVDDAGVLHSEAHRSGLLPPQVELFAFPDALLISQDETDPELRAVASHLGWNDLAVAPLGTDGFDGLLVVANRLADVSTFDAEDLRVLQTFAQNTGVALKVGELVDELRREVAEKDFQAMHDSLTGLPNRERLQQVLAEILPHADDTSLVAVALMDLDDFKDVNDTLGHTTGDALLEEIGRRLSAAVGSRGTVARLGGDEFAVALCCVHSEDDAVGYVEQLRREVEAPYIVDRLTLAVRFSIGVATSPTHGNDPRVLMQRADIAMYAAKKARIGVKLYAEELDTSSTRRLSLAGELAPALEQGDFQLFYQPQLDIRTGSVVALEALARWPHPVHRSVPPDEFIPLVEQSGLIGAFTDWAIDTALRDVALWREEFPELRVSVNMSARNLLQADFPERVLRRLEDHRLPAAALTLELTESEVMSDPERALSALTALHRMGIRLAIDDFGTGYSSLSYLKKLPVTEVKIDRSFVMNMMGSREDIAIVESTVELARSLGMETVAEGVETLEILRRLGTVGCWAAQGYHVARPLPSADVADKIREINAEYAAYEQLDLPVALTAQPSDHELEQPAA